MAEIKPDILSALSQNGSGLQLQSLASSLVEAETSGERVLTERRVEDANTSISAMGQLSSQIGLFKAGMARAAETASRSASSTTSAVSIEVTQEAIAADVSAVVEVMTLASPQVTTFRFAQGTNSSSAIEPRSFSVSAPGWDDRASVSVPSDNATLNGLARELHEIEGLTVSLIDTGDGMALIVKSQDGTQNGLDATSITAIEAALGLTADGSQGTSDADENPLGVSTTTSAATDANFTVDGVAVTRGSNVVDDLFVGHRVMVNSLGTATLTSSESSGSVRERITSFLGEVNALKSYLNTATQRGLNGAEAGPLAGDIAAQSVLGKIRGITTQPIPGFGAEPVYLAELGIMTERDGTLSLDEDRFERVMEENPDIAQALFATQFGSDQSGLTVTGLSFAPPKPGNYALEYDPSTSPATATLDGASMNVSSDAQGRPVLSSSEGDTYGMRITLESAAAMSTTVRYGISLADMMAEYSDQLVGAGGMLARRETELAQDLEDFEDQLTEIEDKAAALTERYNVQFGRMEAAIASLNKTGEYMESLMEAWNSDR